MTRETAPVTAQVNDLNIESILTIGLVLTTCLSLFKALGASVSQGRGSRVRVSLNGVKAVFHEPHPEKETNKGAVKAVREFLVNAGIKLEDY